MKNKKQLFKKVDELGELYLKKGIELKHLSLSMNERKEEKSLKEWKEVIKPIIERYPLVWRG